MHRLEHLRTFGDKSCIFELTVSAQTGALAHFWRQSCILELAVSAQTGALAHFWRQILHVQARRKCRLPLLEKLFKIFFVWGPPPSHIWSHASSTNPLTEPKFKSLVTELMLPRRIDLCSSSTSSSSAHKYGRAESLGVRQQASARALRSRLCELRERESPRASPVRHLLVWLTGPGQQASARAVAIPPLPATVIYI